MKVLSFCSGGEEDESTL
uniref:Uncharacterized protein n=1 Tax=Anguilla anguilla TaxID=7936 RepID=A0A0E9SFH0_ANGAN